jgi:hypothetical protein
MNEPVPDLTGISHIDLTVTDVDRSLAFYREVVGFAEIVREDGDEHAMVAMGHSGLNNLVCRNRHGNGDGSCSGTRTTSSSSSSPSPEADGLRGSQAAPSGTHQPWNPKGTRCGSRTVATGTPPKSVASSTTSSLPSRASS